MTRVTSAIINNTQLSMKNGQQGLYADEFRPAQVPKTGAKVIDLSMGIEDYRNKICIWGLYDLKHHLGGKDDALRLGGQWQAALRYCCNSVLNYLDGYNKEGLLFRDKLVICLHWFDEDDF